MPIIAKNTEPPWQFTDGDADEAWDILDPNDVLRNAKIEVSKEWLDNAIFELSLFVDIDNGTNATLSLLLILRTAIDLYEYHRTVYLKRDLQGGIAYFDFRSIAEEAFKAANKEQFFPMALSYANQNEFIKCVIKPYHLLYGACGTMDMMEISSLSSQGRRFIRQRVGDLPDLPKIEPDEFKNYNPYGVINEERDRGIIPNIIHQQSSTSQAQSFAHGGNVSIVNAPVFNNQQVDLSLLAEAQKYGFDMMRSAIEASRQPITTPPPSPEPQPTEQNDASGMEQAILSDDIPQQVEDRRTEKHNVSSGKRQNESKGTIIITVDDIEKYKDMKAVFCPTEKDIPSRNLMIPAGKHYDAAKHLLYVLATTGYFVQEDIKYALSSVGSQSLKDDNRNKVVRALKDVICLASNGTLTVKDVLYIKEGQYSSITCSFMLKEKKCTSLSDDYDTLEQHGLNRIKT